MKLNMTEEDVHKHIRSVLCVADDHTLLIGGASVIHDHRKNNADGTFTDFYKVEAHIKIIPPKLSQGPYTDFTWIRIRYIMEQ